MMICLYRVAGGRLLAVIAYEDFLRMIGRKGSVGNYYWREMR